MFSRIEFIFFLVRFSRFFCVLYTLLSLHCQGGTFSKASFWWLFLLCSLGVVGFSTFSFPYLAYLYAGSGNAEGLSEQDRIFLGSRVWGWLSAAVSAFLFFLLVAHVIFIVSSVPKMNSIFELLYALPHGYFPDSAQSIGFDRYALIDSVKFSYWKKFLSLFLLSMALSIPALIWTLRDIKRRTMHSGWVFAVAILPSVTVPFYLIFAKPMPSRNKVSSNGFLVDVEHQFPKSIASLMNGFRGLHCRKLGWVILICSAFLLVASWTVSGAWCLTSLASTFSKMMYYFISLISMGWILLDQFRKKRPSFGWLFWMCFVGARVQHLFLFLYFLCCRSEKEDQPSALLSLKLEINSSS